MQSPIPLNYLLAGSLPRSVPSLVLAKSKGYTIERPIAPAVPPDIRFPIKYLNFSVFGLIPATNVL